MDLVCSLRSQLMPHAPSRVGMGAPVGAATSRCVASRCAPSPRCKFHLGFSGLRAPCRYVHTAAPHLSLNVAVGGRRFPTASVWGIGLSRSHLRVGELCYFYDVGPGSPHGRHLGFLELQSSLVFSSFLLVRECRHCSEFCSGDRRCWDRV
ncbi:hypothetical protein NDU88_007321 [Pleurodeles waltl]|uniref:Uncharacterized protein n=1 Tax=Pleurodeles waltl TaxID=8319 RepID=A0AAV7P1U3_PLEWA|nr:hypothetical protein NDU88_007321 [Pleurodeles waltl]